MVAEDSNHFSWEMEIEIPMRISFYSVGSPRIENLKFGIPNLLPICICGVPYRWYDMEKWVVVTSGVKDGVLRMKVCKRFTFYLADFLLPCGDTIITDHSGIVAYVCRPVTIINRGGC
jgi:hypothetical protein